MSGREIVGVRMKLSSPERVRELSSGEVKKPETINYRTLRPEKDGLFCERIFGPTRSFECACGKYKRSGPKFRGIVCDRCGVEVTDSRVRRERMGHIELAAPVVHIWYLRGIPSRLSLLLGTATKDLEKVVYFAPNRRQEEFYKVVSDPKKGDLIRKGAVIPSSEVRIHAHYDPKFKAEKAYRIVKTDDIALEEGQLVGAQQLNRLRAEYGDEPFQVEAAWRVPLPDGGESGKVLPESALRSLQDLMPGVEPQRVYLGNQEAFLVTAVTKLPFSKGEIVSETEFKLFHQKYPGRFTAQEEKEIVEDPCCIVVEKGDSLFERGEIVLEREQKLCAAYDKGFQAGIGAEGVLALLKKIDLNHMADALREEIAESSGQKKRKLIKRLQVLEDFRKSESRPEWMVLQVLPVIPPDLRPMVQLDGGRFATSDLNDLYRRVINRNNRLKKLQEQRSPDIIVRNEKRMLQEAVDALIDNGRRGKAVLGAGNRPLKSLTDLLRGKKGRFRQNLLGKRVDYSGRSVIVIGPSLRLHQCGLPKQMALELFKPFVMHKLVEGGIAPNVKSARRLIDRGKDEVWAILEEIIKDHPVLLNRAPTLHRLGIQAFEPVLIEGKAIRLHPLVCTAFNADFDGDQMAVHVPLSLEAQAEARILMLSANNILSPASGKPVVTPTQDIILGVFYITAMREGEPGEGSRFREIGEVLAALDHGQVRIHTRILLRADPSWNLKDGSLVEGRWIETTPGRVLFNEALHPQLRFINRQIGKKDFGVLLDDAYDQVGSAAVVEMLDAIKKLGYHWSTVSGISLGLGDVLVPARKKMIVDETMVHEDELSSQYGLGILTEDEYMRQKDTLWSEAGRAIVDQMVENMALNNPLRMMVDSGARGSKSQVAQMAGIRGLMADPSGRIIDYPIVANFREGLNMLEYFISTHGARKGLADTALRTAKSGYLTRRLVDVAQDLIVLDEDCGTDRGVEALPLIQEGKVVIPISERIVGRVALRDIVHPETGEAIVRKGEEISEERALAVQEAGIGSVWVRSPLTCGLRHGICRTCYGRDLATRKRVAIGEAVGVVAAQSIGEPGTQLTMRTFHTGGVRQFTGEDITQGLPRIEQLFEVRKPKKVAVLAERDGTVAEIKESEGKRKLYLLCAKEEGGEERVAYNIPASCNLLPGIEEGAEVRKGQPLTEGYKDPQQLLDVEGLEAVQHYLLDGIQEVYRSQGVSINDKHIETILRKVAPVNRVRVQEEGDSPFVAGELVWLEDLEREVARIREENEAFLEEAVRALEGTNLREIQGQGKMESLHSFEGQPLSRDVLRRILMPGTPVQGLLLDDRTGPLRVILGDMAFRRELEGCELIEPFSEGEETIEAGLPLRMSDLARITAASPRPLLVRDADALDALADTAYLAEDVLLPGGETLYKDHLITEEHLRLLREGNVSQVKVWRAAGVERIDLSDALRNLLMEKYWAQPLRQAIDAEGNPVESAPKTLDGTVVRGLVEGSLAGVALEDAILTREKLLAQVLAGSAYGKTLLETVRDEKGRIVAEAGQEVTQSILDALVVAAPLELVLRPILAQPETKRFVHRITFVRRLREEPIWKPVVHGITKAALATDSFLSAASFQQTAQVLAAAAVRGEADGLRGLKENVIIGLLVPAGTGIERYQKVDVAPVGASLPSLVSPPAQEGDVFVESFPPENQPV
jgi:DNA-directed RNA polymerase subunit beta'